MNLEIISLPTFTKKVNQLYKKYKKLPNDLENLAQELSSNPTSGIHLGNSCYKIRLANSSIPTGKSGGFRIIYYYLDEDSSKLFLMTIYSKRDLENIDDTQILEILHENGF